MGVLALQDSRFKQCEPFLILTVLVIMEE